VRVATSKSFQPQVAAAGLSGIAAGVDWEASRARDAFPDLGNGMDYFLREILCWRTGAATAADLQVQEWRPDLVVRELWELGGAVFAAQLGVPCIVHGIGAWASFERVLEVARPRLLDLAAWGELGDDLDWVHGELYLDPCPPSLRSVPLHRSVQPVRPVAFGAGETSAPSSAPPPTRPGIYVGLGTVMNRRPGMLEALVEQLRDLDADLYVTTGPHQGHNVLGQQPENVHVVEYAPLASVIEGCALAVCHAGWGTSIAALTRGIPVLCVPLGADGPDNAAAITAAGAGLTLKPGQLRRAGARRAAVKLLTRRRYRERAESVAAEIAAMPAASATVERIESLVAATSSA
jgi:hypothetical protein